MSEDLVDVAGTHWRRDHEHRWRGSIDASWYQGRALFGGLLAGVLAEIMQCEVADGLRAIRTLNVQFTAPATAGDFVVETEVLRRGRNVTQTSARLVAAGETVAVAFAAFGSRRPHPLLYGSERMPEVPPPDAVRPFGARAGVPVFASHLDLRFCVGGIPFTQASEPRTGGWCRLERRSSMVGALCILLDAWPPPSLVMASTPAPNATIDLSYHFLPQHFHDCDPGEFYLFDSRCPTIEEGYAEQLGELWNPRGVLVARVRQMVAVF